MPFLYDSISVFGNYAYAFKAKNIEKYQVNTYHNGGKSCRIVEVESAAYYKKEKDIKNEVSSVNKIVPLKFDDKNRLCFFAVTDTSNRWGILKIGFKDYFRKNPNYISSYIYKPEEGFDEFLYSNQSDINVFKDGETYYNIDLNKTEVEKERVTIHSCT